MTPFLLFVGPIIFLWDVFEAAIDHTRIGRLISSACAAGVAIGWCWLLKDYLREHFLRGRAIQANRDLELLSGKPSAPPLTRAAQEETK